MWNVNKPAGGQYLLLHNFIYLVNLYLLNADNFQTMNLGTSCVLLLWRLFSHAIHQLWLVNIKRNFRGRLRCYPGRTMKILWRYSSFILIYNKCYSLCFSNCLEIEVNKQRTRYLEVLFLSKHERRHKLDIASVNHNVQGNSTGFLLQQAKLCFALSFLVALSNCSFVNFINPYLFALYECVF